MRVSVTKRAEGSGIWYRLEARDHATGSDEVCSASTALIHGLVGYLANRDDISKGYSLNEDPDYPAATVWCHTEEQDEGVEAVWIMTAISFVQLEHAHPRSIEVDGYMDVFPDDELNFIYINELPADKRD